MITKNKIILRRASVIILSVALFFTLLIYFTKHFEYNATSSLPIGLYKIINKKTIDRNDIVSFCPKYNEYLHFAEIHGFWKGLDKKCGLTPQLLKKAVGLPYDHISINFNGVFVNETKINNSEPFREILSDKIFNNYEKQYQLKADEYLLMSDYHPLSYDSRYFGIIRKEEIKTVLKPFLVMSL